VTDVSVIIVNYNTREHLLKCLESVQLQDKKISGNIYIIDNGSADGSVEAVKQRYPAINIIRNEHNTGFAHAVNQGLKQAAKHKYHLIVNTDVVLADDYLKKLSDFMDSYPGVGIVTGQLLDEDGSIQSSYDNIPTFASELLGKSLNRIMMPLKKKPQDNYFEVESVIGAAMMVRQKAIEEVGLLDEFFFLFLEETDWCQRMTQKKWQVGFLPGAEALHLQGQTKKMILMPAKIEYLNSMYKFMLKQYPIPAYWLFRLLKPIRIFIGLLLNLVLCVLTLCLVSRFRRTVAVSSVITFWHLKLCPENMTLGYISKNR